MRRSKIFWGSLIPVLVVLAYVVPYTLLSDVHAWYGSFLWWGLSALLVIAIAFIITKDWSD